MSTGMNRHAETIRFPRRSHDWRTEELRTRWDRAKAAQAQRDRDRAWLEAMRPKRPDNVILFGSAQK